MTKKLTAMCLLFITNSASAATCADNPDASKRCGGTVPTVSKQVSGCCSGSSQSCNCGSCSSNNGGSCSYNRSEPDYSVCTAVPTCTAGVSDVAGQNYQRIVSCSGSGCGTASTITYRCKAGFYGSGTSCAACPPLIFDGVSVPATSQIGSTMINNCYAIPGTYQGTSGTFTVPSSCNYQ